jgi:hypothetical protein
MNSDTHKHKCSNLNCNYVWEHPHSCFGIESEHTCKRCGEIQWIRYHGTCIPTEKKRQLEDA